MSSSQGGASNAGLREHRCTWTESAGLSGRLYECHEPRRVNVFFFFRTGTQSFAHEARCTADPRVSRVRAIKAFIRPTWTVDSQPRRLALRPSGEMKPAPETAATRVRRSISYSCLTYGSWVFGLLTAVVALMRTGRAVMLEFVRRLGCNIICVRIWPRALALACEMDLPGMRCDWGQYRPARKALLIGIGVRVFGDVGN